MSPLYFKMYHRAWDRYQTFKTNDENRSICFAALLWVFKIRLHKKSLVPQLVRMNQSNLEILLIKIQIFGNKYDLKVKLFVVHFVRCTGYKRLIFGRNRNFKASPCLLSIYSLVGPLNIKTLHTILKTSSVFCYSCHFEHLKLVIWTSQILEPSRQGLISSVNKFKSSDPQVCSQLIDRADNRRILKSTAFSYKDA